MLGGSPIHVDTEEHDRVPHLVFFFHIGKERDFQIVRNQVKFYPLKLIGKSMFPLIFQCISG